MLENIKLTIPFFLISQDGGEEERGGETHGCQSSYRKKSLGQPLKFDSLPTLLTKKMMSLFIFF